MIETKWQTELCKLFRANGAYASKWSTPLQIGKPDLIVVDLHRTFFFECKRLVVPNMNNFKRTIELPPKQKETLDAINKAAGDIIAYWLIIVESVPYKKNFCKFILLSPLKAQHIVADVGSLIITSEDSKNCPIWANLICPTWALKYEGDPDADNPLDMLMNYQIE